MNFLQETMEEIRDCGQSLATIHWIGLKDGSKKMAVEDFVLIGNVEYDDSYGRVNINDELVIVFYDGSWLEREEYDGSEWWSYKKTPVLAESPEELTGVIS